MQIRTENAMLVERFRSIIRAEATTELDTWRRISKGNEGASSYQDSESEIEDWRVASNSAQESEEAEEIVKQKGLSLPERWIAQGKHEVGRVGETRPNQILADRKRKVGEKGDSVLDEEE